MSVCVIAAVGHDGHELLQVTPDLATAKSLLEKIGEKAAKNIRLKRHCDLVAFAIYEAQDDGALIETWQFSDFTTEGWEWVKCKDPEWLPAELAEWREIKNGGPSRQMATAPDSKSGEH